MRTNCLTLLTLRTLCILALATAPLACKSEDEHEHENPNEEACEHLEMGPMVALTAAATSGATAPKINNDHQRYDVTLVDVAGAKGGFVTFAAGTAGDYIIYTSVPAQLEVKSTAGASVMVESAMTSVTECTLVKGRNVYDLAVGTYVIGIGGVSADMVSFVVEASEAH
jgi:hypothetical protein